MNNNPTQKVFDIRRPGNSPADTTSRPSIVTNDGVVRDPTLTVTQNPASAPTGPQIPVEATATATQIEQTALDQWSQSDNPKVPNSHSGKLLRNVSIVFLFLLVVFVGVDLLIDAGIVKTSINPVIDLIKN